MRLRERFDESGIVSWFGRRPIRLIPTFDPLDAAAQSETDGNRENDVVAIGLPVIFGWQPSAYFSEFPV